MTITDRPRTLCSGPVPRGRLPLSPQDEAFLHGEADRWFERNQSALGRTGTDPVARLLELYHLVPRTIIEVGAANGYRVAGLCERTGAHGVAVDPSPKAIEDGRSRYPEVEFHLGVAQDVPVQGQFDLVIVHFVLHWVGRPGLMVAAAEIDRLVADGGALMVGDFLPETPVRVPYHHLPDQNVLTYKQDYAAMFLATGLYRTAALLTGHYQGELRTGVREHDRAGWWFLEKRLTA